MDPAVGDASPPIAHSTPVPAPVAVGIPLADDSAKKEAVAHWSGVHLSEQFTVIVSDAPRKEDARGNMELRLRRHPTTGYSESLESSDWRLGASQGASRQLAAREAGRESVHRYSGSCSAHVEVPAAQGQGSDDASETRLRNGTATPQVTCRADTSS
jgi:hypothetical protein